MNKSFIKTVFLSLVLFSGCGMGYVSGLTLQTKQDAITMMLVELIDKSTDKNAETVLSLLDTKPVRDSLIYLGMESSYIAHYQIVLNAASKSELSPVVEKLTQLFNEFEKAYFAEKLFGSWTRNSNLLCLTVQTQEDAIATMLEELVFRSDEEDAEFICSLLDARPVRDSLIPVCFAGATDLLHYQIVLNTASKKDLVPVVEALTQLLEKYEDERAMALNPGMSSGCLLCKKAKRYLK